MSGHSKWATIKRKKAATDQMKGKVYTKLAKAISVAARDGADPNTNAKLKEAVTKAKSQNMPNDNIERAIKKGSGELGNSVFEEVVYEGYGIGGVAVVVEALTDNRNRTAGDVRHIFDKNGGNLGTNGCVSYLFEKTGIIFVAKDTVDEDTLMMLALENGASDVQTLEEGYEINVPYTEFLSLCDALEQNAIKTESAQVEMIPTTEVAIDEEKMKRFEKMMEMFDDNDDVQDVYHNCANYE